MVSLFLIIIAWVVPMPLWLSITMTIAMSIRFMLKLLMIFS